MTDPSVSKPNLEDVFKQSGSPTYTFVRPKDHERMKVALRTPGRGVIVEGASGIGKTTSIIKLVEEKQLAFKYYTARTPAHKIAIEGLSLDLDFGNVIIDDFHRLSDEVKSNISDIMKVLAETDDPTRKIVLIGINKAGESLLRFSDDLSDRVEFIKVKPVEEEYINSLIGNGEEALNIIIESKNDIASDSNGCFHIAQSLCHEYCIASSVSEYCEETKRLTSNFYTVREKIIGDLERRFGDVVRKFSIGPELKTAGRAPYLHILYWLSQNKQWIINLNEIAQHNPQHRSSISRIIQGPLKKFIDSDPRFRDLMYYDDNSKVIGIEDPKFLYYLKNIPWNDFAIRLGYSGIEFNSRYDIALSFAGEDRKIAEAIFKELDKRDISTFYDFNEQHRIVSEDVEEYLKPIYRSESRFVVPILGSQYPRKIWTQFETRQFRDRFKDGSVLPIRTPDTDPSFMPEISKMGGLYFDTSKGFEVELKNIITILIDRVREDRRMAQQGVRPSRTKTADLAINNNQLLLDIDKN